MVDGEIAEDEPAETHEDHWISDIIFVAVDMALSSMKFWFEKNQPLLNPFVFVYPNSFLRACEEFQNR